MAQPSFKKIKKTWRNYQKWMKCKPLLSGEHLQKMGYVPGPIFQLIFKGLSQEKFLGRCKSVKAEMSYVVDNFRRD